MLGRANLIDGTVIAETSNLSRRGPSSIQRGCEVCPLNRAPGNVKVLGLSRILKRKAMLWAQNPGRVECLRKRELVGPAGQLLWRSLKKFGLVRDRFDIQNVVRCWPRDVVAGGKVVERNTPNKEELRCCSVHSETALRLNAGSAIVHLVLGQVAAKQLLGKYYHKDTPLFWHNEWAAYVVVADHPSFILRAGVEKAGWKYREWMKRLEAVKWLLQYPGRWGYILSQNYKRLDRANIRKVLARFSASKKWVAVDEEDGMVAGKRVCLMVSLSCGGETFGLVLDHPENRESVADRKYCRQQLKAFLEASDVPKTMHYGVHDCGVFAKTLGVRVKGFCPDTLYLAYLARPYRRHYSLDSLARAWFPMFADYKEMVSGYQNYADIPLSKLFPYCCADAHLTSLIHSSFKAHVREALSRLYTEAAYTVSEMEGVGPLVDRQALKELESSLPRRLKELEASIRQVSGIEDLNPGSTKQMAACLFDRRRLRQVKGRSTDEASLEELVRTTGDPIPAMLLDYRFLSKAKGTYVDGFRACADVNDGEVRSKWYLAGGVGGRLRSGGKGEGEEGKMNLQNLHKHPVLKNLLCSDLNWRRVLAE